MKINDITEGYGRYYCSTDKKWKTRKGPKQTRKVSEDQSVAEGQLNEYLVRAGMPVKDVLALNLFQDTSPDGQEGMADDPRWRRLMKKYQPIANMLAKQIIALGKNRRLSDAEAEAVEEVWYDGSDAYDDMEIEYLADYYNMQIETVEAIIAGELQDEMDEAVAEEKQRLDPSCWDSYKKQGTKIKGGVKVNNCVPESEQGVAKGSDDFKARLEKRKATLTPAQKAASEKIMKKTANGRGISNKELDDFRATQNKQGVSEAMLEETYDGDEFFEAYGELWYNEDEQLDEAEYQGRSVPLGKPMQGDVKKFKVYVKDPSTGNVKKVNFGDPDMKIRKSNPAARRSFRARHNCDNPGPRTSARYWSCRKW